MIEIHFIADSQTQWIDLLSFFTAVVLALVTVVALFISYKTYRNQTDPEVVVYADPDLERQTIVNLVIENIGRGVAKRIDFDLSEKIPCRAFGITKAKKKEWMNSGPLIQGIPELGPGARRIITWGQYGGLHEMLGDNKITVIARFERSGVFSRHRTIKLQSTSALEVSSFAVTDASDKNWEKQQADALKIIAGQLKQIARSRCEYCTDKDEAKQ